MFPQYSEAFLMNIIQQESMLFHCEYTVQMDASIMLFRFFSPMMNHPNRIRTF